MGRESDFNDIYKSAHEAAMNKISGDRWGASTFGTQRNPCPEIFGSDEFLEYDGIDIPYPDTIKDEIYPIIHQYSEIEDILKSSNPTDYLIWTRNEGSVLGEILTKSGAISDDYPISGESEDEVYVSTDWVARDGVPADILISNHVPLRDMVVAAVAYKYSGDDSESPNKTFINRILTTENKVYVSLCEPELGVFATAETVITDNRLLIDYKKLYIDSQSRQRLSNAGLLYAFRRMVINFAKQILLFWYGANLLLLNPEVKDRAFVRYKKEKKAPVYQAFGLSDSNDSTSKRKTKYIKYRRLNTEFLTSEHSPFSRKTLCWYVMGHYRNYKSGKKVWIDGYWKGPMRDAKKNLDGGRERKL